MSAKTRQQRKILVETVDVNVLLQEQDSLNNKLILANREKEQLKAELDKVIEIDKRNSKMNAELITQSYAMKQKIEELGETVQVLKNELVYAKESMREKEQEILHQKQQFDKSSNAISRKPDDVKLLKIDQATNTSAPNPDNDEVENVTSSDEETTDLESSQQDDDQSVEEEDDADRVELHVKFEKRQIRTKKCSLMLRDLLLSVFTPDELGECTLSGRDGNTPLDPVRLECVKNRLRRRFPNVKNAEVRRMVSNFVRDYKKKRKLKA